MCKVEKDIDRELEADGPKDEGALNAWFQKIFAGADKETRRAMNKSMQTSNGLVLSTNWAEVKEKVRACTAYWCVCLLASGRACYLFFSFLFSFFLAHDVF